MKKGLYRIIIANLVSLIINIIIGFFLPRKLPMEDYAIIKTFTFYIGYAGFFHLGYCDGVYLIYGGKNIQSIDKNDLNKNFSSFFFMECIIVGFLLIVGVLVNSWILIAFSINMITLNTVIYFRALYQATGELKQYAISLNLEKIMILLFYFLSIFILNKENYNYFIWGQVIVYIVLTLILYINYKKKLQICFIWKYNLKEINKNICLGFLLMLGNFSGAIFTGLDRWFIKVLMSTSDFALYAFAVSIESMLSILIAPISLSLYNYFCINNNEIVIKKMKRMMLFLGYSLIGLTYIMCIIVKYFIPMYSNATILIFILSATQALNLIIKAVYLNIYKANRLQRKYFIQMIFMMLIAICLNFILYSIFNTMVSIATGTLLTTIIWYVVCEFSIKSLKFNFCEIIFMIIMLVIYIITGLCMNLIMGLIVYIFMFFCLSLVLLKGIIFEIKYEILNMKSYNFKEK